MHILKIGTLLKLYLYSTDALSHLTVIFSALAARQKKNEDQRERNAVKKRLLESAKILLNIDTKATERNTLLAMIECITVHEAILYGKKQLGT